MSVPSIDHALNRAPKIVLPCSNALAPTDAVDSVTLSSGARQGTPPAAPTGGSHPSPGPGGNRERNASAAQEQQSDQLRAAEIRAAMAVDRRLSEEKIRAMWANLQTEIMQIWQEVMLTRQKVMADLLDKWSRIMFGGTGP